MKTKQRITDKASEPTSIKKSDRHIKLLIQHSTCEKEIDSMAIKNYCKEILKIRPKFASPVTTKHLRLTYDSFKQWLYEDSADCGDILTWDDLDGSGKITGIVRIVRTDLQLVCATFNHKLNTLSTIPTMMPKNGCKWANTMDKMKLLTAMSEIGLEWSDKFGTVVERVMPVVGDTVSFVLANGRNGFGIVRDVPLDGDAVMFFCKLEDEPIRHSMFEVIGKTASIKFRQLSQVGRFELIQELQKVGKQWNAHARRVEPIGLRNIAGKKYFHIGANLMIGSCIDCHNYKDNRRYSVGNYFRTMEEARLAKDAMEEALKRFHALKPDELGL